MKHFQLQLQLSKHQQTISYQWTNTPSPLCCLNRPGAGCSSRAVKVLVIRIRRHLWPFFPKGFRKITDFITIYKQNTIFFFGEISVGSMGFSNTGDHSGHSTGVYREPTPAEIDGPSAELWSSKCRAYQHHWLDGNSSFQTAPLLVLSTLHLWVGPLFCTMQAAERSYKV